MVVFPVLKNHHGRNMYWDILIRIKNALERKYERVKVPYSHFTFKILESLVRAGYLESVARKGRGLKRIIDVKLKYDDSGSSAISGLKFISRPSRRIYIGYRDIQSSHQGYGHYILSTPEGIFLDKEARRKKLGGQVLFEIW